MAKLILAVSILAGAGACSPAPASQSESPTTTTALVTTTEATTTTEVTTTTEPTIEPTTAEPTTEATVPPTTRATSAPTTTAATVNSADFWYRLAGCESGNGRLSANQFQFQGGTAAKVGYYDGASYEEQRAMAIDWAARIHPNEGTSAGWPVCWWVAQ